MVVIRHLAKTSRNTLHHRVKRMIVERIINAILQPAPTTSPCLRSLLNMTPSTNLRMATRQIPEDTGRKIRTDHSNRRHLVSIEMIDNIKQIMAEEEWLMGSMVGSIFLDQGNI